MSSSFAKSVAIKGRVRICLELARQQNPKGKTIVDIGSSFGWLEKQLVKLGVKKIIGVESNEAAVKFARSSVPSAKFLVGVALDLPLKNQIADIVTLYDVIEHVPVGTEDKTLKEVNRILKPGGMLLMSTPFDNFWSKILDLAWYFGHRHYSKQTLSRYLKKNGFKVISIETKGSLFSSLYLMWFYVSKRLLNKPDPRNRWIEKMDDKGYDSPGITDLFVVAQKT